MVFEFRRIRLIQFFLGLGTLSAGIGCVTLVTVAAASGVPWVILAAIPLLLLFVWLVTLVFSMPNSFVRVGELETRVRFGRIVDIRFPNSSIRAARVVRHGVLGGLGARLSLGGIVTLTAVTGDVAEMELVRPVRIWLIPMVLRVNTNRIRLGVNDPERLVARLSEPR